MKTQLDLEIERLASIVERCLGLCDATQNSMRCTRPANHEPADAHKFPVTLLGVADQLGPLFQDFRQTISGS